MTSSSTSAFAPVERIHQALHAFHVLADDRGKVVSSVHFCSCNGSQDQFQCLVYDSPRPDAKLIGVEYMLSEEKFLQLPEEEKKYWHSHEHEVMSGGLVVIGVKAGSSVVAEKASSALKTVQDTVREAAGYTATGGNVPDALELEALKRIKKLYGKAIHTWHPPDSEFPFGEPKLMMPVDPKFGGLSDEMIQNRDEEYGINTQAKKQQRQREITEPFVPNDKADQYIHSGKVPQFTTEEREIRPAK